MGLTRERVGDVLGVFAGLTRVHFTDEYKTGILLSISVTPIMGTHRDTRHRDGPNIELIKKRSSSGGTLFFRIRITQYKYGNIY